MVCPWVFYTHKRNVNFLKQTHAKAECVYIYSHHICTYVRVEYPLTNLGLRHHCGLAVAERRKWQPELCFFVPLEIQQLPQSKSFSVFGFYKNVPYPPGIHSHTQLTLHALTHEHTLTLYTHTHHHHTPYAHTSINRLRICLAPASSAFGPQMCFIFSSDLSQTDEMWSREAMFFGEAIYWQFTSQQTKTL